MQLTLESFIYALKVTHEAVYNMAHLRYPDMFKEFINLSISLLSGCNQENFNLIRDFLTLDDTFDEDKAVLIYTYIMGVSDTVSN